MSKGHVSNEYALNLCNVLCQRINALESKASRMFDNNDLWLYNTLESEVTPEEVFDENTPKIRKFVVLLKTKLRAVEQQNMLDSKTIATLKKQNEKTQEMLIQERDREHVAVKSVVELSNAMKQTNATMTILNGKIRTLQEENQTLKRKLEHSNAVIADREAKTAKLRRLNRETQNALRAYEETNE